MISVRPSEASSGTGSAEDRALLSVSRRCRLRPPLPRQNRLGFAPRPEERERAQMLNQSNDLRKWVFGTGLVWISNVNGDDDGQ
jgi:hypothetical protein